VGAFGRTPGARLLLLRCEISQFSSGPPGDCMIPSSVTWVMAMIFFMGLSPLGLVLLGDLDFLRSERQLQIPDKVIDTFDRDLRPALRLGENEGALEHGLGVERE
jgi:hypothetical protein